MQLIGLARIGNDPEIRYTKNDDAVLSLSLAYNYGRKGDNGFKPSQWVDAALWGKLAEALQPYLIKGSTVCVTLDDVHVESYEKKDGSSGSKLAGRITSIELTKRDALEEMPAPKSIATPKITKKLDAMDNLEDDIPF
jgi:single-strand DNA-binding protein